MIVNITLTPDMIDTLQTAAKRLAAANDALATQDHATASAAIDTFGSYAAMLIQQLAAIVDERQAEANAIPPADELEEAKREGFDASLPYWECMWHGHAAIKPPCPYSNWYLAHAWRNGSSDAAQRAGFSF